jgi:hypothetical protein
MLSALLFVELSALSLRLKVCIKLALSDSFACEFAEFK